MPNKTPLQTSMGMYLSLNQGLRQDPVTTGNITAYRTVEPIASFRTLTTATSSLSASAASAIKSLKSANLYSLLDTDPGSTEERFTDIVETHMNLILPAELTIFTQVYGIASAGVTINNSVIESNAAINTTFGSTFTTMDNLTTGGFSQVSTNIPLFGADLANVGTAINLSQLDRLGQPSLVVASIKKAGKGYTGFREQMLAQGVKPDTLKEISVTTPSPGLLVENQIYEAMKTVTDTAQLQEILDILDCTIELTSLDQILDLTVMLPNSYDTLQAPDNEGEVQLIYTGGGVNSVFNDLAGDLGAVATTTGLAASARALAKGLRQVKSIDGKTTVAIATALQSIEVSTDLGEIANLTQAMPDSVQSAIGNLAQGSGENGTYVIADAIGSVAGYDFDPIMPNTVTNMTAVASYSTSLTQNTTGVFPLITDVINGVYGSNPDIYGGLGNTLPSWITSSTGNGYGTINAACIALAPDAQSEIDSVTANLESAFGNTVQAANTEWTTLGNRIALEKTILSSVGVDLANLSAQASSLAISWADGVATYALDTQTGGASEFITKIANVSDISGQTVVAALREQRTMASLQQLGTPSDASNT